MPSYLKTPQNEEEEEEEAESKFDQMLNGSSSSTGLLPHDAHHIPQRRKYANRCWQSTWYTSLLILLAGIFYLLAHNSLELKSVLDDSAEGRVLHHHTFGPSNQFSLDHEYDVVFDTKGKQLGVIELPPYGRDGKSVAGQGGVIGMFHQLHCLAMLRTGMQSLLEHHANIPAPLLTERQKRHWGHCFDYIRMGILCSADPTIERPTYENGSIAKDVEKYGVDGAKDVRTCRSQDVLWEMHREHGVARDRHA